MPCSVPPPRDELIDGYDWGRVLSRICFLQQKLRSTPVDVKDSAPPFGNGTMWACDRGPLGVDADDVRCGRGMLAPGLPNQASRSRLGQLWILPPKQRPPCLVGRGADRRSKSPRPACVPRRALRKMKLAATYSPRVGSQRTLRAPEANGRMWPGRRGGVHKAGGGGVAGAVGADLRFWGAPPAGPEGLGGQPPRL